MCSFSSFFCNVKFTLRTELTISQSQLLASIVFSTLESLMRRFTLMFSRNGKNLHFKRKLERLIEDDWELDSSLDDTESTRIRSKVPPPNGVTWLCPPDSGWKVPLGDVLEGYTSTDLISRRNNFVLIIAIEKL